MAVSSRRRSQQVNCVKFYSSCGQPVVLALLLLLAAAGISTAAPDGAWLVVHKAFKPPSGPIAQGEAVTVTITAYNQGSSTAYNVILNDENWPSDHFELVSGNTTAHFGELQAGKSVSTSFVVKPTFVGTWESARASATYRIPAKPAPVASTSNTPVPLTILSPAEKAAYFTPRNILAVAGLLSAAVAAWFYFKPAGSKRTTKVTKKKA
eukprot:jgi/Chlat1/716/Chrsp104S01300